MLAAAAAALRCSEGGAVFGASSVVTSCRTVAVAASVFELSVLFSITSARLGRRAAGRLQLYCASESHRQGTTVIVTAGEDLTRSRRPSRVSRGGPHYKQLS